MSWGIRVLLSKKRLPLVGLYEFSNCYLIITGLAKMDKEDQVLFLMKVKKHNTIKNGICFSASS